MITHKLLLTNTNQITQNAGSVMPGKDFTVSNIKVLNSRELECFIIDLDYRITAIPKHYDRLKLAGVAIVKTDSPMTRAADSKYVEGDMSAYVETTIQDRVPTQYLHVVCTTVDDLVFDRLDGWLAELMNGRKNDRALSPVFYPGQHNFPGTLMPGKGSSNVGRLR